MGEYGAAITWIVALFVLFVVGLLYMMETPLIDALINVGQNQIASGGVDSQTLKVITDVIKIWFPISVIFTIVVWAWRKSARRIA